MAELKTQVNDASVDSFLNTIEDPAKKADSFTLLEMFSKQTGEAPKMWGPSIIGFGQYHYKSERSSQEGDWMLTGFSPRKQSLSLYLSVTGFDDLSELLSKLGKHKIGKGCLYINKLEDVDLNILESLIKQSYLDMKAQNA